MFASLISGLRSIRVSLISGGIIVSCAYIFLYNLIFDKIVVRPAMQKIIDLSSYAPIILIVLLSLIIGSLYTTFLEGIVDKLHRKYINVQIRKERYNIKALIINALLPYSESSKKRLITEVSRFYREYCQDDPSNKNPTEKEFIDIVLIETLWMEGKIAGTTIEQLYDKMRSEGDLRLACGLLLPYASSALGHSLFANNIEMSIYFILGIVLSIPMVNYGLYYYKKANSFLAHHIADGNVLSPSMESLKRNANPKKRY